MELSRSFKRLNEYPPFLSIVHQKTKTSFYKQSRAFDFHMVSLKSRNLDKVVLRPSQNLTKAAVALPNMLTASPCPSVTRGPLLLSPREASAGEVRPRGLWILQPQAPSQSQSPLAAISDAKHNRNVLLCHSHVQWQEETCMPFVRGQRRRV